LPNTGFLPEEVELRWRLKGVRHTKGMGGPGKYVVLANSDHSRREGGKRSGREKKRKEKKKITHTRRRGRRGREGEGCGSRVGNPNGGSRKDFGMVPGTQRTFKGGKVTRIRS